ncbi:MAG: aspartate kinase [Thermoflavifilum sp.]|nr:aspartate kinase [Thermoflavifilum sp.]MCL6513431.1 aspartate kinase [Alicyclobacillus sp.]
MRIRVQKFGGTSVATREARLAAASHVEDAIAEGCRVVVVVSAMGRRGDPYATDTLLSVPDESDAVSKRDLDILMSCGEAISAVVFASVLRSRGHAVTVLSGGQAGILTNDQFGDARILEVRPTRILRELERGHIVVVMGFQGMTAEGDITTLGRGGSDTTATALGVALGADVVDIFTDVDGIMTADPRIVQDARRLRRVTYNEICNLAHEGAKVIHPRAVEIAMQRNIPIRVRSTMSKDEGTLVTSQVGAVEGASLRDQLVTGVTQTSGIAQITVEAPDIHRRNIFAAMAQHGISIDFISVSPNKISYTVPESVAEKAVDILRQGGLEPKVVPDCAKVSVVGAYTGVPGIMAQIVAALTQEGIEILQSADSHTTIWCLVRRAEMERAVRALHRAFELGAAD